PAARRALGDCEPGYQRHVGLDGRLAAAPARPQGRTRRRRPRRHRRRDRRDHQGKQRLTMSIPPAAAAPPPLQGGKLWVTAIALAVVTFMQVLDSTITNVSLPTISG